MKRTREEQPLVGVIPGNPYFRVPVTRAKSRPGPSKALAGLGEVLAKRPGLVIVIPSLPPKEMSPNYKGHWSEFHKANQEAKETVVALVRAQGWYREPMSRALIEIEWRAKDRRVRDFDNLLAASKGYLDGLVLAGVLATDAARNLELTLRYFEGALVDETRLTVGPIKGEA